MNSISRRNFIAASAGALACTSLPAFAQDYPARTISIVIPSAAGSGADTMLRFVADRMRTMLAQTVVIENKPGAFGSIGAAVVAKAKPDGYSLLFSTNITYAATPFMFKNPPFDPVKDFVAIGTVAQTPFFLIVGAKHSTATSVAELTAQLRAKGNKASYGAPTGISLAAAEVYKSAIGLEPRQIPYKTMQQALVDLANGDIDFLFADAPTMIGHLGGDKYRALAVTTPKRSTVVPNLPTMVEAGATSFQPVFAWFALAAPAGTPPAIADKLNATLNKILASEETARFLHTSGSEVLGGSRRDMEQFQAREIKAWSHIAKVAKIEPQ